MEELRIKEDAENKLQALEQEEIEVMKRIRTTTQVHKASIFKINIVVEDFEKLNMGDSQVLKQLINNEIDSPQTSMFI